MVGMLWSRYEASLFLIMYVIYIVLMYYNRSIESWILPQFPSLTRHVRPVMRDTKLQNIGTILSSDDFAANNNDVNEIDIDMDDNSKLSLCIVFQHLQFWVKL